ncbi:hypothetical protein [Aliiruegeria lutimaris]|uniref:hypothetical protein n=1 Tax=Aliiruegeria lutimaris TaxID=571298 RepID=UPI001FCCC7A7|nr:hypothetical protein [Aliiruegeria lutimaris]
MCRETKDKRDHAGRGQQPSDWLVIDKMHHENDRGEIYRKPDTFGHDNRHLALAVVREQSIPEHCADYPVEQESDTDGGSRHDCPLKGASEIVVTKPVQDRADQEIDDRQES